MNIPELAVKRPIFIISIVLMMMFTGWQSFKSLPVDLFPTVDVPFITVSTFYPGAGPKEIESSVTKPIEEQISTLEGVKKINSTSQDSLSLVVVEFQMGESLDALEQRLRARIDLAKTKFPKEVEEPSVQRYNPSNQAILTLFATSSTLSRVELSSWIESDLKPILSRIPKVGKVDILGGQKREIKIIADTNKLEDYRMPLLNISQAIKNGGENVPGGSLLKLDQEINLRTLGQFNTISDIENKIVSFENLEKPIRVRDIAKVIDSSEKERTRAYYGEKQGIVIEIFKQSGANTVIVADNIKAVVDKINSIQNNNISLQIVENGSRMIRSSIADVWESIEVGFILTIIVVYFFLGSLKSTLITGFAIPNSLLGAFVLMALAGFSVNVLTLLALSLSVGLLVDDGIVVRENIFRKMEQGLPSKKAAVVGTTEVIMAVVSSTLAILAIFGPVGFLQGVTGQFFKEFGLVVCFAMVVSLFDAVAVAPLLSAYWADKSHTITHKTKNPFRLGVYVFYKFQNFLEFVYLKILKKSIQYPIISILIILLFSIIIASPVSKLSSGFLPTDQSDEFNVKINMPAGTNLDTTSAFAQKIDTLIRNNKYTDYTVLTVGNTEQESYKADIAVHIKLKYVRSLKKKPSDVRDEIKQQVANFENHSLNVEILVVPHDITGTGMRAFSLILDTNNFESTQKISKEVFSKLKDLKSLSAPSLDMKPGGKELQIDLKTEEAQKLGVNSKTAGMEIRARVEGIEVGKLHDKGEQYKISLTTNDSAQRWLDNKNLILIPNINMIPIDLRKVAKFTLTESPSKIDRYNRSYSARISADIASGVGLSESLKDVRKIMAPIIKNNPSLTYAFEGDSESYEELSSSMGRALLFGLVFLFLVLASLYESFLISFLNIVTLPLAVSGAFFALFIFHQDLNLYSMIGILLLLGVATKNSILLIDTANEKLRNIFVPDIGLNNIQDIIVTSSVRRLRPILMTSIALIAGAIPIAVGLNEASAQRTSMGIAIVGGIITSTLFSLLLVPSMLLIVQKVKLSLYKAQLEDK